MDGIRPGRTPGLVLLGWMVVVMPREMVDAHRFFKACADLRILKVAEHSPIANGPFHDMGSMFVAKFGLLSDREIKNIRLNRDGLRFTACFLAKKVDFTLSEIDSQRLDAHMVADAFKDL